MVLEASYRQARFGFCSFVHAMCCISCLACSIACRGNVMLAEVRDNTLPLKFLLLELEFAFQLTK
jgi:hypothetical protein